eukprot:scaffold3165_cov380-Prasinococcus_capsulatus_cf.AAC.5
MASASCVAVGSARPPPLEPGWLRVCVSKAVESLAARGLASWPFIWVACAFARARSRRRLSASAGMLGSGSVPLLRHRTVSLDNTKDPWTDEILARGHTRAGQGKTACLSMKFTRAPQWGPTETLASSTASATAA